MQDVKAAGFAGVQNFPTVGLIDGLFRAKLEETGMGFGQEVDMIRDGPRDGSADHALCLQPDEAEVD